MFAATQVGPYLYIKNHDKWYPMSGLETPDQSYWSVNYIPETKTARFATYGRGIWDFKISQLLTDVKDNNMNFEPSAVVSPNPASIEVMIHIKGKSGKTMTAKIFDSEGNQVINLFSGIMNSDNQDLKWNLSNSAGQKVTPGAYLIIYIVDGLNNYAKINVVK
jgi:hypothetical protein